MKKILAFIVTHWITLLSGAVAAGAIALCVMGMTSNSVAAEMKEAINKSGASGIAGIKGAPQNEATIQREKERGQQFEEQYRETMAIAKEINARPVLMEGVFPTAEKEATPFEFKQKYATAVKALYKEIDAGTLPTEAEIIEEEQNVDDLIQLEEEQKSEQEFAFKDEKQETAPAVRAGRSTGGRGRSSSGGGRGRVTGGGGRGRDAASSSGGDTAKRSHSSDEPKYDPEYRARVEKARSIRCYYDELTTFHTSPIVEIDAAPTPEEMWFAQVTLWVQNDVLKAIREFNEDATAGLDDSDACVQQSPIKHLTGIRVHGYEVKPQGDRQSSRIAFESLNGSEAGNPAAVSPTGRLGDDQFDVIRFGVTAVVDQRDIIGFIDKMTQTNFYQCISVGYQSIDQAEAQNNGYFYGDEPSVMASFEFEGYMSREVYAPLMPNSIKELLGIKTD